jgi:hypothetical protein
LSDGAPIGPQLPIGASGIVIWDAPGGQFNLGIGSGLQASLLSSGDVEVAAYYVKYDEQAPITKEQARKNTLKLNL